MRLVLFLPWLTNCLRPVGVHPPTQWQPPPSPVPEGGGDISRMGKTSDPWSVLVFVVACLRGSSCQDWVCACPSQCQGLTDHRDGPWLPRLPAGSCFAKHQIGRWSGGGGLADTQGRWHWGSTARSPQPIPSQPKRTEELSLLFRGIWWHVWAPASPTYLKIPHHGCLPLFFLKNPSYIHI